MEQSQRCSIWVGFDPREATAFAVARHSIKHLLTRPIPINGLVLDQLRKAGLYYRPTTIDGGKLYDVISAAHMATEFAISRFLVPSLAGSGWALFLDADMLARANLARLFDLADPRYAVMCVKHNHAPVAGLKMDGQVQVAYPRKNWSSFLLFNCDHPANRQLDVALVNCVPGRDLHRLSWIEDDALIGELGVEWNWLVGHSPPSTSPKVVHFTDGGPWLPGYEDVPYADEWRDALRRWAA